MGNAKQIMCYSTRTALSLSKKQQLPDRDQVTSQSNDKPTIKGYSWQQQRLLKVNGIAAAFFPIISEKLITI